MLATWPGHNLLYWLNATIAYSRVRQSSLYNAQPKCSANSCSISISSCCRGVVIIPLYAVARNLMIVGIWLGRHTCTMQADKSNRSNHCSCCLLKRPMSVLSSAKTSTPFGLNNTKSGKPLLPCMCVAHWPRLFIAGRSWCTNQP